MDTMNTKVVTCCQINMQKSKAAAIELNNGSDSIVLITEPSKIRNLNRANTQIFFHEGHQSPRAAIRVDQDLSPWLVPEYSDRDMCVVAVKLESKLVYVCSLYLDINLEVCRRSFSRLIDWCNRERISLIVGMDSNAHSPLWGCPDKNERGEALEEVLLTQNLTLLNVGHVSTFVTKRAESIIDLTVVNCYALENLNLEGWKVETEDSFSDHRYISFSIGKYKPAEQMFRNLKKANWALYEEILGNQE